MIILDNRSVDYSIDYEDSGVYLTVNPSGKGLTKEEEVRILNSIKRKNIKGLNSAAVFDSMHGEPNDKIKIAESQKEETIDQEVDIKITDGGLKAKAILLPSLGGENLTFHGVQQQMMKRGVVFGIDEKATQN